MRASCVLCRLPNIVIGGQPFVVCIYVIFRAMQDFFAIETLELFDTTWQDVMPHGHENAQRALSQTIAATVHCT